MTIDLNPDLAQWFTPDWLADHLLDSVPEWIIRGDLVRAIEPAAGTGAIVRAVLRHRHARRSRMNLDAIEVDPRFEIALNSVRPSRDDAMAYRVEICNYLDRPAPETRYDLAITNPPFTRGMEGPFIAKLLDECNFIAAILPSRSLHGIARYDAVWKRFDGIDGEAPEWALRSIKYCKRRPKFAGTNGGKDEIVIVAMERLAAYVQWVVKPSISWI